MDWENELAQYELAADKVLSERDRILCLEDLCPDALHQHFETRENLMSYADYMLAISDYVTNRVRWVGTNRVNWVGFLDGPAEDIGDDLRTDEAELTGQVEAFCAAFPQLRAVAAEISVRKSSRGSARRCASRSSRYGTSSA